MGVGAEVGPGVEGFGDAGSGVGLVVVGEDEST